MRKTLISFTMILGLLIASPGFAQQLDVRVTNLTNAIYFTPLLASAHPAGTHIFQPGTAASANLQAMAEGGDISGLVTDLQAVAADIVQDPAGGFLAPGVSAVTMMSTTAGNTHLSIAGMLLPTNDGFVGIETLEIPTAPGTYTYYLNAYDAGTEANDEIITGGGMPGVPGIPADPGMNSGMGGTGAAMNDANTTVHIHRGVLGDSNLGGGVSDLDSTVHRWLNPVAELTIIVN